MRAHGISDGCVHDSGPMGPQDVLPELTALSKRTCLELHPANASRLQDIMLEHREAYNRAMRDPSVLVDRREGGRKEDAAMAAVEDTPAGAAANAQRRRLQARPCAHFLCFMSSSVWVKHDVIDFASFAPACALSGPAGVIFVVTIMFPPANGNIRDRY